MKGKYLLPGAILLLSIIALVSALRIRAIVSQYRIADDTSDALLQYVSTIPPAPENTENTSEASHEPIPSVESTPPEVKYPDMIFPEVDFPGLLQINEDVVGWICIEGTGINYPIVQGSDNLHYTSHMSDGKANAAGSIFLDFRNNPDFSDRHSVIYGHNMRNGTMFAGITRYKNPDFVRDHSIGMLLTPERNYCFEIIGGYVASVDDPAWQLRFDSDEEFLSWLRDALSRSGFDVSPDIAAGDKILTLSTCSYEFSNARYVLICRILP